MGRILADGIEFDAQDYLEDALTVQPCLIEARQKHGHALCMCTSPHRQLVIREVNGVLYLAVWPNDGHHHDPSCEFYRDSESTTDEDGRSESGTRTVQSRHSPVKLNSDGTWNVALDMPALKGGKQEPPSPAFMPSSDLPQGGTRAPARETFSLQEFLTWLWDNTSMNRWGKGWRRDWWRVAQSVRTEAQAVVVAGRPLNEFLYIPPPFRRDKEAAIHAEWDRFVQPLIASSSKGVIHQRGLLLVEVKSIDRTEFGYKIQARNVARPIFLDDHLHATISRQSPLALALLPKMKELGCTVVGMLLIESTDRGNLRAVSAALMLTNSKFIPVATLYELQIANAMCADDRTFTRGVGRHVGADFVLRDTRPNTAIVIYSLMAPDYVRKRNRLADDCAQAGCAIWKWEPSAAQGLPRLPPPAG